MAGCLGGAAARAAATGLGSPPSRFLSGSINLVAADGETEVLTIPVTNGPLRSSRFEGPTTIRFSDAFGLRQARRLGAYRPSKPGSLLAPVRNRRWRLHRALAVVFGGLFGFAPHLFAAGEPTLVVVNEGPATKGAGGGSVAFLASDSFEIRGLLDLPFGPSSSFLGPDGRFLYLLSEARASQDGAPGPGSVAVVGIETRTLVARIDAGIDPTLAGVSRDGSRLYWMGSDPNKRGSLISIVDRATHRTIAAVMTAPGAIDSELSPDEKRLFVLCGDDDGRLPPLLVTIDVEQGRVLGERPLLHAPQQVLTSNDGKWLYVLDRGNASGDPAARQGIVFVLDASTGEEAARLAIGREATAMRKAREGGRVYVASRQADGKTGQLHAIFGKQLVGSLAAAERPFALRWGPDERQLLVLGERSVAVVDPELRGARSFSLKLRPKEVVLSPDGRRGFVGAYYGNAVAALDLESGAPPQPIKMSRGRVAGESVSSPYNLLAPRRDGRFLYAASTLSNQVRVIDSQSHEVVATLDTGERTYELSATPNPRYLYVKSATEISVLDTTKNLLVNRRPLDDGGKGLFPRSYPRRAVTFCPARRTAFVADGKSVHVLSLRTGELLERVDRLPQPRVVFVPPAADRLEETRAAIEAHLDEAYELEGERLFERAIEEYRRIRRLAPERKEALFRIVELQRQAGNQESGRAELEAWLNEAPPDSARAWEAATWYASHGLPAAAIPLFERVLSDGLPKGVAAGAPHIELARAHMALHDWKSALRCAQEGRRLGDSRAELLIRTLRSR